MKLRQRGISLVGTILVAILIGMALLLGLKMVGPYQEYFSLKHILAKLASEAGGDAQDFELRKRYERQALVDGITQVKPGDLVIRRAGASVVIEADYAHKVPLVGNISLLIDFKVSSREGGK
ncbi:MAG: DUF4845 domain-containing protein [Azoarcus sp.]|jgi:hypothetical protein|nr:DUF4845 domain-containing protein [Azoarcus sp.]